MLKKIFFSLLFFVLCISVHSQTANQYIKAGDKAYQRQDFISAITYYTSALKNGADELDYGFKLAESHRLFHNYKEAEKWYRNSIQNDQQNKFPLANFWLAMVLKKQMQYEQAENFLNNFLQNPGNADEYFKTKARVELQAVAAAPRIINDSLPMEVIRLSDRINSRFSEFAPFAETENKIYLSSIRYMTKKDISEGNKFYVSKIFTSEKTHDWSRPKLLTVNINSDNENNSNAVINKAGDLMFFTRCNAGYPAEVKCKLFYSRTKNGRWQKPVELPASINMKDFNSTQPTIAEEENGNYIIYFVSDRPGGIGKNDIWFTVMDSTGNFSAPLNAGNIINTPGDEITPYYNSGEGIIYFSSDYHIGIGGFDIFSSNGNKSTWTAPINMGVPINSGYDDLYFNLAIKDSLTGFLASNRPGSAKVTGEACCYDIYSFNEIEIIEKEPVNDTLISGNQSGNDTLETTNNKNITDTQSAITYLKSFLPLELYFHNDEPDPRTTITSTKKNYEETYNAYINLKEEYRKLYAENLTGNSALQADASILRFFEEEVESGMRKLEEFSSKLLERLEAGDSFTLKLKGYTSPLATNDYNINLAHRRISSLINYFHQYRNGAFKKYLDIASPGRAKLILIEEPVGESTAPANVSDDLYDTRKSIYSPEAAAERRIEIISVDVVSQ